MTVPVQGQASALLEAATRMHDSGDPESLLQVIAVEALQILCSDGVVVFAQDRNGLTPVSHLAAVGGSGDLTAVTVLCSQLGAAGLLSPGQTADLDGHPSRPNSVVGGVQARGLVAERWRSLLVVDLDSPHASRPTRLLWYATATDAFITSGEVARLFARSAGLALRNVKERHHLQRAVESRTLTGQATGILMARRHLSASEAFEVILRHSQNRNLKLREVAETIIRTGNLPT